MPSYTREEALQRSIVVFGEKGQNKHVLARSFAKKHGLLYINLNTACTCDTNLDKLKADCAFYKANVAQIRNIEARPSLERRFVEFANLSMDEFNFRQAFPYVQNLYGYGFKSTLYNEMHSLSPLYGELYKQICVNTLLNNIIKELKTPCVLDMDIEKHLCHTLTTKDIQDMNTAHQHFVNFEPYDQNIKTLGAYLQTKTPTTIENIKTLKTLQKFGTKINITNIKNTDNYYSKFCRDLAEGYVIYADFIKEKTREISYGKKNPTKAQQCYTEIDKDLLQEVMDIASVYYTPTTSSTENVTCQSLKMAN